MMGRPMMLQPCNERPYGTRQALLCVSGVMVLGVKALALASVQCGEHWEALGARKHWDTALAQPWPNPGTRSVQLRERRSWFD